MSSTERRSQPNNSYNNTNIINNNPLLTPKAFSTSLTPPRVPPFGSIHRELYSRNVQVRPQLSSAATTKRWSTTALHYHVVDRQPQQQQQQPGEMDRRNDENDDAVTISSTFQEQVHHDLLYNAAHRRNLPHPHMDHSTSWPDATTRYLRRSLWSVDSMNKFRDTGMFRAVADGLATITVAPLLAMTTPPHRTIFPFLRLTRQRKVWRYGTHHERQFMEVWERPGGDEEEDDGSATATETTSSSSCAGLDSTEPPPSPQQQTRSSRRCRRRRRWIVFVHGGAWGSGEAWMYRLVAAPFLTSLDDCAGVIICSYRVYPDGTINDQVNDLNAAIRLLLKRRKHDKITLMGHSSGAHVALLWLVQYRLGGRRSDDIINNNDTNGRDGSIFDVVDSFVGLSGPYDIAHHFDYEAGRGVEELSPMKPVNGHNRAAFRYNSPAQWLLLQQQQENEPAAVVGATTHNDLVANEPRIVLVHGTEDDTVPFTATAEAARLLMACGLERVEQVYLPHTGHQDVPMQLMVGGRARDVVLEWISALDNDDEDDNMTVTTSSNRPMAEHQARPILMSKL
jgi:acetyl esterase/lipase